MMARVAQEIIERVRDASDILDVVSKYVDLKKRGQNYSGLCPFHNEKTPSFSVAPAKEIFHCLVVVQ
jgi:DNA primase